MVVIFCFVFLRVTDSRKTIYTSSAKLFPGAKSTFSYHPRYPPLGGVSTGLEICTSCKLIRHFMIIPHYNSNSQVTTVKVEVACSAILSFIPISHFIIILSFCDYIFISLPPLLHVLHPYEKRVYCRFSVCSELELLTWGI